MSTDVLISIILCFYVIIVGYLWYRYGEDLNFLKSDDQAEGRRQYLESIDKIVEQARRLKENPNRIDFLKLQDLIRADLVLHREFTRCNSECVTCREYLDMSLDLLLLDPDKSNQTRVM